VPGTLFWDVDTQVDFMDPGGALYVPGAETIVPNLERLTEHARKVRLRRAGSVDHHSPDDPEISLTPDFGETYPPHCIAGTPGAAKIPATQPENPLWIPSNPIPAPVLAARVREHPGEILLQKQRFDVFSNPNTPTVIRALDPERVVVYGVALDVCDRYAVEGFLRMGGIEVWLVEDAAKAIRPERVPELLESWRRRGVRIVRTEEALSLKS
jgi:nicotinamidase/pyrazinamidase